VITDTLKDLIHTALQNAQNAGDLPQFPLPENLQLETPRNKQHGDYSSNAALTLKKAAGLSDSRHIAQCIIQYFPENPHVERLEIAGPGFLNFYLKPTWLHDALLEIEAQDDQYGTNDSRAGERIMIEFVSANPTGPISVVNGRAAALGDVLANLLEAQGCVAHREYYINDALNSLQLEKFAASVRVRYQQFLGHAVLVPPLDDTSEEKLEAGIPSTDPSKPTLTFPKDGYRGEYVKDIAKGIYEEKGAILLEQSEEEQSAYFRTATLHRMVAGHKEALEAFGVHYDTWFFESTLYAEKRVEETIEYLKSLGQAYEKEGALWLRSSDFGDEKDRVLVRSNEKATYIAADIAYHKSKFDRGYTHLINIWGADHHGYVARLKAGIDAVGQDSKHLDIILTQMVSLVRDGEAVIGGKRKGSVIELKEDLVDDIGKDAARFYFLLNSYETPATVDVELAKRQSNDNPVYYVQYAHARLCNILRRAEEEGIARIPAGEADRSLLVAPAELDVLRKLTDYGLEITTAAKEYAPHRLPRYAMELASLLNVFYETCRVLSGKEEQVELSLSLARLALVNGARIVMRNLLNLLEVTPVERM
jgi:arginyl-tRNA synthetase